MTFFKMIPSLPRGLAGPSVGHPVKGPPLVFLALAACLASPAQACTDWKAVAAFDAIIAANDKIAVAKPSGRKKAALPNDRATPSMRGLMLTVNNLVANAYVPVAVPILLRRLEGICSPPLWRFEDQRGNLAGCGRLTRGA